MTTRYRGRVVTALRWSASGEVITQGLRVTLGIVLARLLSPPDFGVMAMLMVVLHSLVNNADLGLEEALVQRRDVTEAHRATAFWVMLGVALVLTVAQILLAEPLATFYGVPQVAPLAVVLSSLFIFRALVAVPRAMLTRELDFRAIAMRRSIAVGLGGMVAILMAFAGYGAVSLAAELLISTAVESALLIHATAWFPRVVLQRTALRELAGFGLYRPVARALGYWAQRIDQVLIGRLLGSSPLGLYARAFNVGMTPVVSVSRMIVGVLFPSLTLLRDEPARIRDVYVRALSAVALVVAPLFVGLVLVAEPFVDGVLGQQWHEMIPLVRVFAVVGLCQTFTVLASTVYLAQGRPDLLLRLTVVQRVSMIVAIVVALQWGLTGIALAQLVAAAINAWITVAFTASLIELSYRTLIGAVSRVTVAAVTMALAVALADAAGVASMPVLIRLAALIGIGAVVYVSAVFALHVTAIDDLRVLVRRAAT